MRIFQALEISASALTAERLRLDIIANNIANVNTTRTPAGGPYRRQFPVFAVREGMVDPQAPFPARLWPPLTNGVRVVGVFEDRSAPRMVYNPSHPDANAEGYVAMPNIDLVTEMVDMISAARAYEANVTVINEAKSMALKALEIGRR
ncbi:MAG: flagellar basal body rod protein FlgC [Bacillota bacterium]|nr:flagellar basal body rod protein FlgC [Bacillota bacterium]